MRGNPLININNPGSFSIKRSGMMISHKFLQRYMK
ncbi:hypothetical protein ACP70R_042026 [Stipagrostis hirtigluma subsp. patula]